MDSSIFKSFTGGIELTDVISCVFCKKQQLTQLVQLGCFHLSCKVCLQKKLEDPSLGAAFNCPECDMLCMVPMGGVDEFPDEPLQHKMKQITAIFSNDKPKCMPCELMNSVSTTTSVCITCKINLCENDAQRHQGTPGHKVIKHEELCVEPNLSLMLKSKVDICQEHTSEKKFFCIKCQLQICLCAMSNHFDHKKDSLKNIATEYRSVLGENLREIKKTERKVKANVQKLEQTFTEIQDNYKKSMEKLRQEDKEERIKQQTLQKIDKEAKIGKNQVRFKITEEKNKIKQCQSAESYIKVFLKFSSDSDVIEKYKEILTNLENCEIIREYKGACSLSDKMQGIRLNENVNEINGFFSRMKEKLDENLYKLQVFERKRLSGLKLECKWLDEWYPGVSVCEDEIVVVNGQIIKWWTMDGRCKRTIKCVDLGCACRVDVCQDEVYVSDKKSRAVFVFDREGKMKRKLCLPESETGLTWSLGLTVDKMTKDIYVSSKRTNTVYKYETESQKFIPWITYGWRRPRYLCVTLDHHLVVSYLGSDTVVKYNPEGQPVWSYGCEESGKGQLSYPLGVCSDPLGHIFIVDCRNDRIVVISKDGNLLRSVDIGEKIVRPYAVSFRNQRLAVTTFTKQIYVIRVKYV